MRCDEAGFADLDAAAVVFHHAQHQADRAALDRTLSPDYVLVSGRAEARTRNRLIVDLTDPRLLIEDYLFEPRERIAWTDGAVLASEGDLDKSAWRTPHERSYSAHRYLAARGRTVACRLPSGDARPRRCSLSNCGWATG